MATSSIAIVVKYGEASCCGIILDSERGLILTVGSLFLDPVEKRNNFPELSSAKPFILWDSGPKNGGPTVEILLQKPDAGLLPLRGYLTLLWRDQRVLEVAARLFPASEWHFDHPSHGIDAEKNSPQSRADSIHKLADFALVRVDCLKYYSSVKHRTLHNLRLSPARQGENVTLVGTPFGAECPRVFFNSTSQGIVSNLADSDGEILMTDARCIPGGEGSALFLPSPTPEGLSRPPQLYGIVVSPFCWRNGEWIGITLACSIRHLLSSLSELLHPAISKAHFGLPLEPTQLNHCHAAMQVSQKTTSKKTPPNVLWEVQQSQAQAKSPDPSLGNTALSSSVGGKAWLSSVVFIQHGVTWGTGVVMDSSEGLVVTCSHVVTPQMQHQSGQMKHCGSCEGPSSGESKTNAADINVYFGFPHPTCRAAEVLFATEPACPLDLALLRITTHPSLTSMPVRNASNVPSARTMYEQGEEVLAVGFALFPRHLELGPSVTLGLLSNIISSKGEAVMLQSTAAVHSGASGGALVSRGGELLGIITSNIRDASNSTSFPHINFSIPTSLVMRIITMAMRSNIQYAREALISQDISDIWGLKNKRQPLLSKL